MEIAAKLCQSCGAGLEAGSLQCGYCGSSHVVTGAGFVPACPACGAGNPPSGKHCVQCAAALQLPCPECAAHNPIGSRFCGECRIEFKSYRAALRLRARDALSREEVEQHARDWLASGWFRARDLDERLRLLETDLLWVPVWRWRARAAGTVQGKVSQTHYRNTSSREYDAHTQQWVERSDSVPYQVWSEVSKEFEQEVVVARPACAGAPTALYDFLGEEPSAGRRRLEQYEDDVSRGRAGERVFDPDRSDAAAYAALRAAAEARLRETLLEKVELLRARYREPGLTLVHYPVWSVLYRYRRTSGTLWVDGATGRVDGKRVTLLSQLFG